ncbi:MAG: ABC transporter substrate-binding protein, partial [Acidimicrobiales bacterium]
MGAGTALRHPARPPAVAAAAAALAALLLAACGGPPARPQVNPPPPTASTLPAALAGPAETGASITLGLPGAPTNWNPLAATGPAGAGAQAPDPVLQTVADAVLPSAFVVGPGMTPALDRQVVSTATVTSTNPQTVTYRIDPRATWSDGVAVTAADFAYTWEADSGQAPFRDTGGAPYTPASTAGYADVTGVAGRDGGRTVVVTFASPDPDWRALFSPLLPAHIGRAVGFDHGFTDPVDDLVSAGPMVVQSYQPGVAVTLVRNPAWWGPGSELSTVTIDFVADPAVAGASLLAGQLDGGLLAFTPGA